MLLSSLSIFLIGTCRYLCNVRHSNWIKSNKNRFKHGFNNRKSGSLHTQNYPPGIAGFILSRIIIFNSACCFVFRSNCRQQQRETWVYFWPAISILQNGVKRHQNNNNNNNNNKIAEGGSKYIIHEYFVAFVYILYAGNGLLIYVNVFFFFSLN